MHFLRIRKPDNFVAKSWRIKFIIIEIKQNQHLASLGSELLKESNPISLILFQS